MFKKIAFAAAIAGAALGAQAQTNLLTNGSFESTSNGAGYCYLGNVGCTLQDWTGTVPVMASNNGPWGNPSALGNWDSSFGSEQVGIQNGSTVQQVVAALSAGTYTLTWFDAGRAGYQNQAYDLVLNGQSANRFFTNGGASWLQRTYTFTTTGDNKTIKFAGVAGYAGDGTSFIDKVSLTAVPEPTSTALMMVGTLALLARRRRISR